MLSLFSKNRLFTLLALLSLNTINTSLVADSYPYEINSSLSEEFCCPPQGNRLYIGGYGGGIYSNSTRLSQTGVAFFTEAEGGPLAVDARGNARKKSSGFGGVQVGYEWTNCPINIGCTDWNITPAVEFEAYFYRHRTKGSLFNPTVRLPEHDFVNTLPMRVGVYLIEGVLTLNHSCMGSFSPYVGGGIGATNIRIRNANSLQIDPPEAGINHFNSKRHDSTWAFAAQAKAGIRYNFCEKFHIFAEYRFLFVDSSNYRFGSTNYPQHAPTTTWDVEVKNICYNAFAIGIQYDL